MERQPDDEQQENKVLPSSFHSNNLLEKMVHLLLAISATLIDFLSQGNLGREKKSSSKARKMGVPKVARSRVR
jgi:hypothetical protein